ncbi:MAG: NifU N-terminal domain-containing protein [Gemmatimonadota bacterium]|nr:NifU N-terminal domain-containing protein [Gemmatimonadota bacterium]
MTETPIQVEGTPNPNAAKFVLDRRLGSEGRTYFRPADAQGDALAERLFAVRGVRALFLVENFITVTKADDVAWDEIVEKILCAIREALAE